MPSNSRLFVKPFIGGLNTELSNVEDAILYTADELNCTILPEGIRGRRLGFNIERDGKWIESNDKINAQAVYHWRNVTDDKNFIVLQINTFLHILEDLQPHSLQKPIYSIDLSEKYMSLNDSILPLSMTSVKNTLFISSKWILPLIIKYDYKTKSFSVEINNLKFRDVVGIEDGFEVDEMPFKTNMNQEHLYNLYNQGWDMSIYDPETKTEKHLIPINDPSSGLFFENVGKYPSNTMQWSAAKTLSLKEDDYGLHNILNTYLGNTPAPKGHYILDYLNRNRSLVSGIYLNREEEGDTPIGTGVYTGGNNLLFRGSANDANQWLFYSGLKGYGFSKDYVPDVYYRLQLPSEFTGTLNSLLVSLKDIMDVVAAEKINFNPIEYSKLENYIFKDDIALDIIGIDAEGNKTTIATKPLERFPRVTQTDVWTQYKLDFENDTSYSRYELFLRFPNAQWPSFIPYSWEMSVSMSRPDSGEDTSVSTGLPSNDILEGAVTDVASFGGRIFYLCDNLVLFSQTLTGDVKGYDKCYQENDPTSEEISDVLATDGGLIFLTSIGTGVSLKSFYRGVIVFGKQEVIGVLSNAINLFSATDYDIVKITNAGICGKFSAVETDLNIFYWSQHGIYMLGLEDNNIYSKCISSDTIQRFYNNLPDVAKENVIGYYDYASNKIFWFYPTTNEIKKLDGCLVYDLINNSFMVYSIDTGHVIRDEQNRFIRYVEENDTIKDGTVYDKDNNIVGYVENKYIVDCTSSSTVTYINPTQVVKADGKFLKAGGSPVIAFKNTTDKNREKTAGIILVSDGVNYSFGAFNDTSFKDWGASPYESYMISKPIMFEGYSAYGNPINTTHTDKQVPVLQTLFKRTEQSLLADGKTYIGASGAFIRMRWGWSLDGRSNRWDMVQNGYRPQKDFLHDEYVESRIHVRGRGKAFQVEIRNDDNKDFRLAGMNLVVRSK